MKSFSIDSKNRIHVEDSPNVQSNKPGPHFGSEQEWARIAADFSVSRLVGIWNKLSGVAPVQRFTSRQTALSRIWTALQSLEPKQKRTVRKPDVQVQAETRSHARGKGDREGSKGRAAQVIALLEGEGGASLEQLVDATGWQKHSVRGFLSGTIRKKMGMEVISSKNANGARVYRINAAARKREQPAKGMKT
jgi:Protein of unknown function (DUF3489)